MSPKIRPDPRLLETVAKSSQCALCGEEGRDGVLVVRWTGLAMALSCLRHGDDPRTRPIDHVYESARRHGFEARYGEGITDHESAQQDRKADAAGKPLTREEHKKRIDAIYG